MNINKKRYYFLPFLDYILSLLVTLLFTAFFGSWFSSRVFGIIAATVLTLVMCGFVYSRMWKLGRKNARYDLGLDSSAGVRFLLPLVLFSLLITFVFVLAKHGVLPLKNTVLNSYYAFPDNLPRYQIITTPFDYLTMFVRFWFCYFWGYTLELPVWLMCIGPCLAILSAAFGFRLGAENKEILDKCAKVTQKAKDKFNE